MKIRQDLAATVLIVVACYIARPANGQGLNNHFAIDSADVQNALRFLGMEMYKFPVTSPDASKRFVVNTIVEEYRNGKLISRQDDYEWAKHRFKDPAMAAEMLPTLDSGVATDYIRVYTRRDGQRFSFGTSITNVENSLEVNGPPKGWVTDSRAMDYTRLTTTATPLVVYYGQPHSVGMMHCPGDRTVRDIRNDYGYVAILSAQLMEVKD